jgi:RNA polymerase sigma factor (sigma-70 family)
MRGWAAPGAGRSVRVEAGWVDVGVFEGERGRLFGVAYRMLGSAVEAEDVVQEAWLRWARVEPGSVVAPGRWLVKVVVNLCLSALGSAWARRETYVGEWLPEPVVTEGGELGPLDSAERRDSVSVALLVMLERLGPVERAVFVLREAFGYPYREIGEVVGLSEVNCRQVHRRAAARLGERERFAADRGEWRLLVDRFLAAARDGDLAGLEAMLADGVVNRSDGGGKAPAARRAVVGAVKVARMYAGLLRRYAPVVTRIELVEVNGAPGLAAFVDGDVLGVLVLEVAGGRIAGMWTIANPEKLGYLRRQLTAA